MVGSYFIADPWKAGHYLTNTLPGGGKSPLMRLPPFIQGHITLNEAPFTIPTFSNRRRSCRYFSFSLICTLYFNQKIYGLFSNCTVSFNPTVASYSFDLLSTSRANDLDSLHLHHLHSSTISSRTTKPVI